mgnify:CR=1 FL=1
MEIDITYVWHIPSVYVNKRVTLTLNILLYILLMISRKEIRKIHFCFISRIIRQIVIASSNIFYSLLYYEIDIYWLRMNYLYHLDTITDFKIYLRILVKTLFFMTITSKIYQTEKTIEYLKITNITIFLLKWK